MRHITIAHYIGLIICLSSLFAKAEEDTFLLTQKPMAIKSPQKESQLGPRKEFEPVLKPSDFEDTTFQFKPIYDREIREDYYETPMVMKFDPKDQRDIDQIETIEPLYKKEKPYKTAFKIRLKKVLQSEHVRCIIFHEQIIHPDQVEGISAYDLYTKQAWTFNQFEDVPKFWKNPGILPLSFSIKQNHKIVNIFCSTKDHVNPRSNEGRRAYTNYSNLLSNAGIDIKKVEQTLVVPRTQAPRIRTQH